MEGFLSNESLGKYSNYQEGNDYVTNTNYDNGIETLRNINSYKSDFSFKEKTNSNYKTNSNENESDIFNYLESKKQLAELDNDNYYTLPEKVDIKENDPNYETKYLNPIEKKFVRPIINRVVVNKPKIFAGNKIIDIPDAEPIIFI